MSSPLADGTHCGARIAERFLTAPTAELDTSCTAEVVLMVFELDGLWPDGSGPTPLGE